MLAAVLRASISSDACLSERSSGRSTPYSWSSPSRSACCRPAIERIARTWFSVAGLRGRGRPAGGRVGVAVAAGLAVRARGGAAVRAGPAAPRRGRAGGPARRARPGGRPRRRPAHAGVEGVQVALEQCRVELDLHVAARADRAVVRQADLATDAHVEFQGHDGFSFAVNDRSTGARDAAGDRRGISRRSRPAGAGGATSASR